MFILLPRQVRHKEKTGMAISSQKALEGLQAGHGNCCWNWKADRHRLYGPWRGSRILQDPHSQNPLRLGRALGHAAAAPACTHSHWEHGRRLSPSSSLLSHRLNQSPLSK